MDILISHPFFICDFLFDYQMNVLHLYFAVINTAT